MIANIMSTDPPTLGWGGGGSEHGHVAYQIKWNRECSNMQAHFLSLHTLSTPGVGSRVETFFSQIQFAYQIRREWSIEHHASTYSVLTDTLEAWGGVKGQNIFFLKVVMLHIKLKAIKHRALCKHLIFLSLHTPSTCWLD